MEKVYSRDELEKYFRELRAAERQESEKKTHNIAQRLDVLIPLLNDLLIEAAKHDYRYTVLSHEMLTHEPTRKALAAQLNKVKPDDRNLPPYHLVYWGADAIKVEFPADPHSVE